jgi:CHAD domain-containing protein
MIWICTMDGNSSASVATTGRFAKEQADRLLGRLAVQIARTIRSHGAAEVHDLRVAIRRFTRVLVVFKACFPRSEAGKIRQGLKKLMLRAGSVRDRDIALRLLAKRTPSASDPLARQFRTEREEAAKALAISLKRWVRRHSSAKWRSALADGLAEDFRADPVEDTAQRILPRMAKEYFRCGKNATRDKAPVEELHRFRIAAKNLRYTLDLFAPLYEDSIDGILQQLKGVQNLLGGINDCATVRRMVSRHAGSQEILTSLKKRQRRKAGQFRQHWAAAFSSGAVAARWTDCLRHVPGQTRVARKPPGRSVPATMAAGRRASA